MPQSCGFMPYERAGCWKNSTALMILFFNTLLTWQWQSHRRPRSSSRTNAEMSEVAKQLNVQPASFGVHQAYALTKGQKLIIELLNRCIREQRVLTREDITRCWIAAMCRDGYWLRYQDYQSYIDTTGTLRYRYVTKERPAEVNGWTERYTSMPWFRNNLGSCIIKGGILAIPVIQIDDDNSTSK